MKTRTLSHSTSLTHGGLERKLNAFTLKALLGKHDDKLSKKPDLITVETPLTPDELEKKLHAITITDFSQLHNSSFATYYGEVKPYSFDIKNVRYGPMSHAPGIKGEVLGGVNHTTIKVKIDVEKTYKLIRNMYYSTLLPIGIIIMLLSLVTLGGTDFQIHGLLFSSAFIICAFLVVALEKSSLFNVRRRELKDFVSRIDGKIISSEETN